MSWLLSLQEQEKLQETHLLLAAYFFDVVRFLKQIRTAFPLICAGKQAVNQIVRIYEAEKFAKMRFFLTDKHKSCIMFLLKDVAGME